MDVLEELKYYCYTANPVGALMLSGEWGCGKTYLIKNKLVPALEKAEENKSVSESEKTDEAPNCVVLCVSLFGLDSIDAIKQEVRNQWLEKASEIIPKDGGKILSKAADGYKKLFGTIKEILPEKLQNGGEAVSSIIDLVNYIPVTNTMYEKKVILVFDDMERSNISSADILGCINDYCENQHFNVIIIANEDKIRSTAGEEAESKKAKKSDIVLSYDQIKEKIVQRVIPFVTDYTEVVDNSIESVDGIEYRGFLRQNKEILVTILAGDIDDGAIIANFKKDNYKLTDSGNKYEKKEKELRKLLEQRPHNIRSLKCAIQDFKRVYDLLTQVGIDECDGWLISFTCYMMAFKAGLISDVSDCGIYLSNEKVRDLYPDIFNSRYMVKGIARWIVKGDWNQTYIKEELKSVLKREEAETPVDILRTHLLPEVEDKIVEQGFSELMELAYSGELTIDEYVGFIENCYWARTYEVDIPEIDWKKVKEGIESQFEKMLSPDYEDTHVHRKIPMENKGLFSPDEWSSYELIKDFREQDKLVYEKNRRLYIDLLSNNLNQGFEHLGNKRYDALSAEMEEATYNAYKGARIIDKQHFPGWFSRIWINFRSTQGMDAQLTEESLKKLSCNLKTLRDDYQDNKEKIAAGHTQKFIEEINKILEAGLESEVKQ